MDDKELFKNAYRHILTVHPILKKLDISSTAKGLLDRYKFDLRPLVHLYQNHYIGMLSFTYNQNMQKFYGLTEDSVEIKTSNGNSNKLKTSNENSRGNLKGITPFENSRGNLKDSMSPFENFFPELNALSLVDKELMDMLVDVSKAAMFNTLNIWKLKPMVSFDILFKECVDNLCEEYL